jgi:hypothetical protein
LSSCPWKLSVFVVMLCMSDLIASCAPSLLIGLTGTINQCRCFCYLVTAVCDNIAQSNSCLCCVLLLLPTYCDSFLLFLLHTLAICFLSVMMFALGDRHCSESWQRKWRPSSGFSFSKGWCGGAALRSVCGPSGGLQVLGGGAWRGCKYDCR